MKKTFYFSCIVLFLLAIGVMGCGAGGMSRHGRGGLTEELDPFEYGDEFDEVAVHAGQAAAPSGADSAPGTTIKAPDEGSGTASRTVPAVARPDTAAGGAGADQPADDVVYRVQIGVFEDQESAKKLAADAESKIGEKVTIEFEPPFYRVRVGQYATRKEAEIQAKNLREQGFRGSFWVMKRLNGR